MAGCGDRSLARELEAAILGWHPELLNKKRIPATLVSHVSSGRHVKKKSSTLAQGLITESLALGKNKFQKPEL